MVFALVAPARWRTQSIPLSASATPSPVRRSATVTSAPSRSRPARAEVRRTRARTACPLPMAIRARLVPMKPLPPVSKNLIVPVRTLTGPLGGALIQTVGLVPSAAHQLDRAVDQVVVLQRPGDLPPGVAESAGSSQRFQVEDRIESALAKAVFDSQRDQPHPLDFARGQPQANQ